MIVESHARTPSAAQRRPPRVLSDLRGPAAVVLGLHAGNMAAQEAATSRLRRAPELEELGADGKPDVYGPVVRIPASRNLDGDGTVFSPKEHNGLARKVRERPGCPRAVRR